MKLEDPNKSPEEVIGLEIINSLATEVENQHKWDITPNQCYGDFSNKAPFTNFSNHSEFYKKL